MRTILRASDHEQNQIVQDVRISHNHNMKSKLKDKN